MANFFTRLIAQVNPFDKGATFKNPTPQPQKSQPKLNVNQIKQFVQQHVAQSMAHDLSSIPNLRLQGLEQLYNAVHGGQSRPITLGSLSHHVPVLSQAETYAEQQAQHSKRSTATAAKQLSTGVVKTAARYAPYVAPVEAPIIGLGDEAGLVARLGAKAANTFVPSAVTSAALAPLAGERNPKQIAKSALEAGLFNAGTSDVGLLAGVAKNAIKSNGILANQSGHLGLFNGLKKPEAAPTVDISKSIKNVSARTLKVGPDAVGPYDPAAVEKYRAQIKGGEPISPIVIKKKGGTNFIVDGKHRVAAMLQAGIRDIPTIDKGAYDRAVKDASGRFNPLADQSGHIQIPGRAPKSQFSVTLKKAPNVSPEVKSALSELTYKSKPQAEMIAAAEKTVKANLAAATEKTMRDLAQTPGRLTDAQFIQASKVAEAHAAKGNTAIEEDIYRKLQPHGTRTAQSLAARNVLSQLSPQGMKYKAQTVLESAGVKFEGTLRDRVNAAVAAVSGSVKDSPERGVAIQKLTSLVNDNIPRSRTQAATDIWRTGLLTGPETLAKVATSYGINTPAELLSQLPSAAVDKITSLFTGKRALKLTPKGIGSGFIEGAKAAGTHLKSGVDLPNTGGFTHEIGQATHQTPYEKAVFRAHGSLFKPAYSIGYQNSLASQAGAEASNQGLRGAERANFIKSFIANPSSQAAGTAVKDAEFISNMQKTTLGKGASGIAQLKAGPIPVGKILAPFTRIPSAIGTKGLIDYTPLGLGKGVSTLIKGIKSGKFDQRLFSQEIGRAATGTGIAALGTALMSSDRMTLKAPSDPKEKALWAAEGKTPNSIKIGNKWVSLNTFGAAGITLGLGGAFQDALKDTKDPVSAITQATLAAGGLLADQPYFKGIAGFGNALSDPTRYANSFFNSTVGSVVPAAAQQVARGFDKTYRAYPASIADKFKSEIPGLRDSLPAQQDIYGQKLPGSNPSGTVAGGLLGTINPFYPNATRNQGDPVTQELQRLYSVLGSSDAPSFAPPTKIGGKKATPNVLNPFEQVSGPIMRQGITNLLNNPDYRALSDQQKSDAVNRVISAARGVSPTGLNHKLTAAEQIATNSPDQLGKSLFSKTSSSGKTTISLTSSTSSTDPRTAYQAALKTYQQKKTAGQLTPIQDYKAQQSLAKQSITSQYPADVVSFYGLSNTQKQAFFKADPTIAKSLYDQAKQLDAALGGSGTKLKLGGKPKKAKVVKQPKVYMPKLGKISRPKLKLPKVKAKKVKVAAYKRPTGKKLTISA